MVPENIDRPESKTGKPELQDDLTGKDRQDCLPEGSACVPENSEILIQACLEAGNPGEAVMILDKLIRVQPADASLHFRKGLLLQGMGDHSGAIMSYTNAIACDDRHADSYNNIGTLLVAERRFAEAAAYFKQAASCNPEHLVACNNLGKMLLELDQLESAAEIASRVLQKSEENPDALFILGTACMELGKTDAACGYLARATRARPDFPDALNNYAVLMMDTGRKDEAVRAFEQLLELQPGHAEACRHLARLGNARHLEHLIPMARAQLEQGGQPLARQAQLHFALSTALEKNGDFSGAFRHLLEGNKARKAVLQYDAGI